MLRYGPPLALDRVCRFAGAFHHGHAWIRVVVLLHRADRACTATRNLKTARREECSPRRRFLSRPKRICGHLRRCPDASDLVSRWESYSDLATRGLCVAVSCVLLTSGEFYLFDPSFAEAAKLAGRWDFPAAPWLGWLVLRSNLQKQIRRQTTTRLMIGLYVIRGRWPISIRQSCPRARTCCIWGFHRTIHSANVFFIHHAESSGSWWRPSRRGCRIAEIRQESAKQRSTH